MPFQLSSENTRTPHESKILKRKVKERKDRVNNHFMIDEEKCVPEGLK
jgi:hypothetical protein